MHEGHLPFLGKVILSRGKGITHHSVARGAPVERCRTGHSAIHPVVGVDDGDALSLMAETSVLASTSVEVVLGLLAQRQLRLSLLELSGPYLQHALLLSGLTAEAALAVLHLQLSPGLDREEECGCLHHVALEGEADLPARVIHENLCRRLSRRVAEFASRRVLEEAEDVVAVKVEIHHLSRLELHLYGVPVQQRHFLGRGGRDAGGSQQHKNVLLHVRLPFYNNILVVFSGYQFPKRLHKLYFVRKDIKLFRTCKL